MVDTSDNILSFPDRHRSQEEAAYWLIKLESEEFTSEDSRALREWLRINPEHKNALMEIAVLWNKMNVLAELSDLFPLSRKTGTDSYETRSGTWRSGRRTAVAACLFIAICLGVYLGSGFYEPGRTDNMGTDTAYQTAVGERRLINLPDGSEATMNTDSILEVAYTKEQRNIRLVKGEAHFNVAHDQNWPFLVYAGTGIIRAVGTAFSVHLKGEDVEVVVDQGSVKIASTKGIPTDSYISQDEIEPTEFLTTINAGQGVEYEKENIHPVRQIEPKIMSQKLSWQHGMLVFDGDPLDKVVKEICRYTNTRIIIRDPGLRNVRVGGYFKTGETEALLTVLQDNFSVLVERSDDNMIYLSAEKLQQASRDVQQPIETQR